MRNLEYTPVLASLTELINKGRIGLCDKVNLTISVKGSEHDYFRCIRNINQSFRDSQERYNVSSCADRKGQIFTKFTSSRFNLEVVNV